MKLQRTILITILMLVIGSILPMNLSANDEMSVMTAHYDSKFARDWILVVYELTRDNEINAPAASRVYAYTAIALYEGVVNGMPENFSIGGQIGGLALLPYPEEGLVYDFPSVANASISTVVTGLFEEAGAGDETPDTRFVGNARFSWR